MVSGLWGRKIGMTQVFSQDLVVPVTVIDMSGWFVTNIRTADRDGYVAVQVGCVRNKYAGQAFSSEWLKNLKKYFAEVKEVKVVGQLENITLGKPAEELLSILTEGDFVDVFGITKGSGFAGCIRRHDFNGPPGSHGGQRMGKRPGSMSFMRSRGRVIKGKRLPGHMGQDRVVMKSLSVVKVGTDDKIVLVKGSVPGKSGSIVFLRKV